MRTKVVLGPSGIVGLTARCSLVLALSAAAVCAESQTYTTSWVGNTYGAANSPLTGRARWVPQDMRDLCVSPGGTVYSICGWEEGAMELGAFKDGDVLSDAGTNTHGWGRNPGPAVAVQGNYLYTVMYQSPSGNAGEDYPHGDTTWETVCRYSTAIPLRQSAFPGGRGYFGSFLIVEINNGRSLSGLATSATELFVSVYNKNQVKVYRLSDMSYQRTLTVEKPRKLAIDRGGKLWVLQDGSAGSGTQVSQFSSGGTPGMSIVGLHNVQDIAIDNLGHLMVGDNGDVQQVLYYDISGATPNLVKRLGQAGGLLGGTAPGRVAADKFLNITGVGADSSANAFVAFNTVGRYDAEGVGNGAVLRSFAPAGALNWELHALNFIDCAAVDPASDGAVVYTKHERFDMDLARPDGRQWTWRSHTLDDLTYPQDLRSALHHPNLAFARRMSGQLFLFTHDMDYNHLGILRMAGDLAVPCGLHALWFDSSRGGVSNVRCWVDKNANGAIDAAAEMVSSRFSLHKSHGKWVDDSGDIWIANEFCDIAQLPFGHVAANGIPYWDSASTRWYRASDFTVLGRIAYQPSTNTMVIAGYTAAYPVSGAYSNFQVIRCYRNWTASLQLAWEYVHSDRSNKSLYLEGDYVFSAHVATSAITVLSLSTGAHVVTLTPGPEVGATCGWQDIPSSITAFRRSNGEYLVFEEDDARAKVLMYRWSPFGTATQPPVPLARPDVRAVCTQICFDLSGRRMAPPHGARSSGVVVVRSADGGARQVTKLVTVQM